MSVLVVQGGIGKIVRSHPYNTYLE